MSLLRSWELPARLLAIVAAVLLLDFAVNTVLFERASRFALQDEEADTLADRLAVAWRLLDAAPVAERPALARELGSETLDLSWSAAAERPLASVDLTGLQQQLIHDRPLLADARLRLHLAAISLHGPAGTMALHDRSVVSFRSHAREGWSLKAGQLLRMALPTLLLAPFAWALVFASLRPLRKLVRASRLVATPHARPLAPDGPPEVRQLIAAFNAMQERIDQLLESNSQAMLAIGHDMRTPLARLQLRLDGVPIDPAERAALDADFDEMRDLFASLEDFVRADQPGARRSPFDLAAMAETIVDNARDHGFEATYDGPDRLVTHANPVALRRALANLVENACHYGGSAEVTLGAQGGDAVIAVSDRGPGIPEEALARVLQPFVRLDAARARNTSGMGLGLAIVDRAIRGQGGTLSLANRAGGGLVASIRLPLRHD